MAKCGRRWEGKYEVSSRGRVRSVDRVSVRNDTQRRRLRGRVLAQTIGRYGVPSVMLSGDRGITKRVTVARLVLTAFRGVCPNICEASHLNGNATDNRLSNLVWETRAQNMSRQEQHGTRCTGERNAGAVLNEAQVRIMRRARELGVGNSELASVFGVTYGAVWRVVTRRGWRHVV